MCKCWFTDNKASIEFHERGKRHKENVQKRLAEIGKKSQQDHDLSLVEDDYIKQMEQAALKAYKKDIDSNPDFTGSKVAEIAKSKNSEIVLKKGDKSSKTENKSKCDKSLLKKEPNQKSSSEKPKKWHEAKTPEGFSYYWNVETGASVWEPPAEGYVSFTEQNKSVSQKFEASSNLGSRSAEAATAAPTVQYGPVFTATPYSSWEQKAPVATEENVDLQLPCLPEPEYCAPAVVYKRPELKFKEKEVTLSGNAISDTSSLVSFKKRKAKDDQKSKNMRQRIVDD